MLTTDLPPLSLVLAANQLSLKTERPFPNDGWSGARLTRLRRGTRQFILKRDSLRDDWIARATNDGPVLREAWFAARHPPLPSPLRAPYLGVGADGDEIGLLMPDLTGILFDWQTPIDVRALDRLLGAIAVMHAYPWGRTGVGVATGPWCPVRERVLLISRPALERLGAAREAVAERLLPGWDAFERTATPDARELVATLSLEPHPLLAALAGLSPTLLHGDLKLANAGFAGDGEIELIDWQMVMFAPVAIDLGWFLAANVATLPLPPDEILERYRIALQVAAGRDADDDSAGDLAPARASDLDLAWIVGLLLRGWRKGHDAEAGTVFASGMTGPEDLELWCRLAVAAANRHL